MTKESNSIVLARIDERLKNHMETNTAAHKEIIDKIDTLSTHVNHEISELKTCVDKNMKDVSDIQKDKIATESKYKGRMELFKWLSIALGTALTTLSLGTIVAHILGLF